MTTTNKSIAALVIAVLIFGGVFYEVKLLTPSQTQLASATPPGGTFSTAKMAAISIVPSTASATSSSIINPAGQDVYVTDNFVNCENATTSYTAYTGAALANWNFKAATTSSNTGTAVQTSANFVNFVMNDNIATGTNAAGGAPFVNGVTMVASSTLNASSTNQVNVQSALFGNVGANSWWYLWPAGTYLTFWSNATNTANCTVGVHYISS